MMMSSTTSITVAHEDKRRPSRRLYKCFSCGKAFRRNEHCIRHERAHTLEKPFDCQFCGKFYARKDLVKRHERTLHADEYKALHSSIIRATSDVRLNNSLTRGPETAVASSEITATASSLFVQSKEGRGGLQAEVSDACPTLGSISEPQCSTETSLFSNNDNFDGAEFLNADSQQHVLASGEYQFDGQEVSNSQRALGSQPAECTETYVSPQCIQVLDDNFMDLFAMDSAFPVPNLSYSSPGANSCGSGSASRLFSGLDPVQSQNSAASPFLNTEREHSRKLFNNLPRVLREKSDNFPRVELDEDSHIRIHSNVCSQLGEEVCKDSLPSFRVLRRLFSGYIDCFHRHLPMIHLPSLKPAESPSALILAMSCIGALYRLDRRRAASTYCLARKLLDVFDDSNSEPGASLAPVWSLQTRLLLTMFAFFTGEATLVKAEYRHLGSYLIDYRLRRISIMRKSAVEAMETSWEYYISRESQKRALCGINIVTHLVVVAYDATPGFVNPEDFDFEMPDQEKVWNARSAEEWRHMLGTRVTEGHRTMKQILVDIIAGDQKEPPEFQMTYKLTGFGALVLAHAVCIYMWTSLQFTQAFGLYGATTLVGTSSLRSTVASAANATLARCHKSLTQEDDLGGEKEDQPSWDHPDGPLIFNSQAVLRIAYTRLFMPANPFRRIVLINGTEEDIDEATEAYVASLQERNTLYTKAAAKVCEGFLTPVQIGHLLVRKTAALSWSIEHAVVGWDSALFLTKWVHTVEIGSATKPASEDEQCILAQIKNILIEMEQPELNSDTSLAATLSKAWSTFFLDVWVWGITPKMGFILQRLGHSYQRSLDRYLGKD